MLHFGMKLALMDNQKKILKIVKKMKVSMRKRMTIAFSIRSRYITFLKITPMLSQNPFKTCNLLIKEMNKAKIRQLN